MGERGPTAGPDHPRTRGVYDSQRVSPSVIPGSSPHTRGLREAEAGAWGPGGIIPAHAGFTSSHTQFSPTIRDHPRTRGVYCRALCPGVRPAGSSPHTRGLPGKDDTITPVTRIIPAHAGFTPAVSEQEAWERDHPRTRGVYVMVIIFLLGSGGSSPHTRGLPVPATPDCPWDGIIPAHAGFTTHPVPRWGTTTDHPRTRGVYTSRVRLCSDDEGSSPHTRGLPQRHYHCRPVAGIIPAHAGFTGARLAAEQRGGDHPRTRGVYLQVSSDPAKAAGSSPHTRGLRLNSNSPHVGVRIIPAHAGFTAHCH